MNIVNSDQINATGTYLQGKVTTTQETLRFAFGDPTYVMGGDKTTTEWVLEIEGVVCTIYDWKLKDTPWSEYAWHVGGKDYRSVEAVQAVLDICMEDVK